MIENQSQRKIKAIQAKIESIDEKNEIFAYTKERAGKAGTRDCRPGNSEYCKTSECYY